MKNVGIFIAAVALFGFSAGFAPAEDKKVDAAKLVGVWKVTKAEGAPEGATVEFTKDGKIIIKFELEGKKMQFDGTYKVEGETLHTAVKIMENEQKDMDTIKVLSDDKLTLVDKAGKESEFAKVKK